MPFQGNPRAGAPSTSPVEVLNLLFQQKTQREKMAFQQQQAAMAAQRQAQIDAAEEVRKNREHQLKAANSLFDLQSKIEDRMKTLGESQETARRQVEGVAASAPVSPQAAPIINGESLPAGTFPLTPQDEQNAYTQLRAQDQSYGPVLAQQAALANYLKDIPETAGLVSQIPSLGAQALATRVRRESEKTAASQSEYDRQLGMQKDKEIALKRVEDEIRDNNVIQDVISKGSAEVDLATALQQRRNSLRADIKRIQSNGGDASDLEEQVGVINGRIASIREPRTVVNKSPIPFEQKVKLADGYIAADYTVNRAKELWEMYKRGEVQFGVRGALENVRLKAGSIMQQILSTDPNIDPETRSLIQSAIDSGKTEVKISDQLSLGLDQILMTYGVARSGRGSVRFAVAEIIAIAQQFDFTGVFTTPEQIRGGLRRAAQLGAREKALNKALMGEDPEFQASVTGIELLPEDQKTLEFLGAISRPGAPPKPAIDRSKPIKDPNTLSDEDLEAMFPE